MRFEPIWVASRIPPGFPAGGVPAFPGEREVPEPDLFEEVEPGLDLLDDHGCDPFLPVGELQIPEEGCAAADRNIRDIDDRLPVDPHREHLVLEPLPPAGRAVGDPHIGFELALPPLRLRLGIEPCGLGEEAFPFPGVRPLGIAAFHAHREVHPLVGAEHQRFVLLLG